MKLRIALLACVAAVLIPTVPASAALRDGVCQWGDLCLYSETQARGLLYDTGSSADGNLGNNYYVGSAVSVNDSISSIQNLGPNHMHFYTSVVFFGQSICLNPGTATSFGVPTVAHMNNKISSLRPLSSC